jgi:hypothetical protein
MGTGVIIALRKCGAGGLFSTPQHVFGWRFLLVSIDETNGFTPSKSVINRARPNVRFADTAWFD